ncbi:MULTISPECIES: glycosyltransferase family 2 protein [unclassified Bacteroides]|uniref:glycosyltransferase family 2 protein n=1 Tax=unclassified Bacteroides TaxID=2646097 RepID=UPI000E97BEB8|nr:MULTISPECIES: glycosyltransferase family 2 protein [unclassified Bacteroides]RGN42296.1 glycosyltransferase family 2 protein [Bacteroides sp. OM05-12]RHR82283.1 glycosyltransferase family 2 protein [Bacteroides sp. AF16-49]
MNYKISILVAAYNAEKYIGKCLDSLINQTLREIQIICIDDASTDGTLSILRQYKEMDSRIYILEQKNNQGQAKARNRGLSIASGEFIAMVDSDDWIELDAFSKMYGLAMEYPRTDAVLFNVLYYIQNTSEIIPYKMRVMKDHFSGEDALSLSLDWSIHGLYMIRNDIHQKYPYDDTSKLHSDDNTSRIHFLHCREVRLSDAIYYYRQHIDSMTKKCSIFHFDLMDAGLNLKKTLIAERVNEIIISKQEDIRWKNIIGEYSYFLKYRTVFSKKEQEYILDKFRFHLSQIEINRLDFCLRHKLGYIPFRNHFKLFCMEVTLYLKLQKIIHLLRGIK